MLVFLLCFSLLSSSSFRFLQLFHALQHLPSDSIFPSHPLAPTVTDIVKDSLFLFLSSHLLSYGYYSLFRAKHSWSPATCTEDLIVACLPQAATSPHANMCKFLCSLACTSVQSSSLPWLWYVQSSKHPFFVFFKAVRTQFLFFTHSISWTWWQ